MDKGLWFASPKKTIHTLLNVFSISVGIILVSYFAIILSNGLLKVAFSVSLVYTVLAKPSTIIRVVPVFLVRTIHDVHYQ